MASFRYRAMTAAGQILGGMVDAPSREAALQQIRSQGHYPVAIASGDGWRDTLARRLSFRRAISTRDLAIATQELATLLHAGLPLDRALAVVIQLGETARLHDPITGVLARVRDGACLADALAADSAFPKLYVSMVRAGETGGTMDVTLNRLADYLAKAHAVREAVRSALVYPAALLVTSGLSILLILVYVLPQFEPLFRNTGTDLPLPTQVVMALGTFLANYGWIPALLALIGLEALRRALQRRDFRRRWDAAGLRLPIFGNLLAKFELERFSRTLGTLLGNGVALPTALGITSDTLSNSVMAAAVGEAAVGLREGEALADRLARAGIFPAISLDFICIGEETGKLDEMLLRQADIYEQAARHTVDRLLAILVPLLTVMLGAVVAGLIGSMLVAIISINDLALK